MKEILPWCQKAAADLFPSTLMDTGAGEDSSLPHTAAALAERIGDFNQSMDPWERTGAAPQGWATPLQQSVLPVQGYIHLRPQGITLPSFGSGTGVPACVASGAVDVAQAAPRRVGKVSPSVSIFARAPVCPDTRLLMMTTLAMTVSRGCYFLNAYLRGNSRSCLCVTPGVRSVLPNDVVFVMLMKVISACGVNDRWSCSLPPLGAGTPGQKKTKCLHEPVAC